MLILAGVSISAIVGDDGVLSKAQYANFINEMAAIEEAVQMWKVNQDEMEESIPTSGICQLDELQKGERLRGEIGFYRAWSATKIMPGVSITTKAEDFNEAFKSETVIYPVGVQDLYYLNNEELGINQKKQYLIDATTGIVYSSTGISINGVRVHSSYMAKSIMSGDMTEPIFAEAEVSGGGASGGQSFVGSTGTQYVDKDGNPVYKQEDESFLDENGNPVDESDVVENEDFNPNGFKLVAEVSNPNLYKLYNNGDLYAKGAKGILLNSSDEVLAECNQYAWISASIPSTIPGAEENACTVVIGCDTVYAIDKEGYLWAWGSNSYNKMGLDEEAQINFSSYVAQKLNVDGKKVKKVFGTNWSTYVVTQDDMLYASGGDLQGELGIGEKKVQTLKFEKIDFPENPNNIKEIGNQYSGNTTKQGEGFSFILTNNKIYFCGRCSTRCPNIKLVGYTTNPEAIMKWTEVDVATMFPGLNCSEAHISGSQQWWEQPRWYFYQNNLCYLMYVNGGSVSKVDNFSGGTKLDIWSAMNDGSLIRIEKSGSVKYYCSIGPNVVNALGTKNASGAITYAEGTYDVTETFAEFEDEENAVTDIWSNIGTTIVKLNNGEIYGCGLAQNLGIGETAGQKTWVRLTGLESLGSSFEFPKSQKSLLFKTADQKIIGTNKNTLILGEKILEKSWALIQTGVRDFNASTDGYTFAYVGADGYLYVRGTRSNHLGLNKVDENITTLTKVDGAGAEEEVVEALKTGVKKYFIRTDATYILTNNNKLLASGYNYRGKSNNWGTFYYGLGTEEHPELVLMSDNVLDFDVCTSYRALILKADGVYTWGMSRTGYITSDERTIKEIPNKTIWNGAGNWVSVRSGLDDGFIIGENYVVSQRSNGTQMNFAENIVKVATGGAWIFLGESGKIYGFGDSKFLGNGKGSLGTTITDIELVNSGNKFIDIVAGSNFAIAYTEKGEVFGTGTNEFGILGRWKGAPRNSSRYRTAFEWVECPELEI